MTAVDFSAFVDELGTVSAAAIMPFFRSTLASIDKSRGGVFDPVTEADRASETVMRKRIKETFPEHGIVGEEFGAENPDAEFVWVLDPIDGTKAFISGLPVWGTLIGLMRNGVPAYGMMHQPFTKERFFGDCGSATLRSPLGGDLDAFYRVEKSVRLTRYGCDCYAYCMVAAGHMDLVIESNLKPYDVVALIPIIEGAGGVITNWQGGPAAAGGSIIAAGDKRVHEEAMKLLNR
jgi:myo-inositol-1(or 4)-monophosphatase